MDCYMMKMESSNEKNVEMTRKLLLVEISSKCVEMILQIVIKVLKPSNFRPKIKFKSL